MQRPGERGATLLDAVVGTALMLVVFVGIFGAFKLTVSAVSNNKARAGAIALANERLEYIRSLPYNAIGTTGGIPSGTIAQTETVTLNDVAYTRRTFVSYEDDPNDGTGGADSNGVVVDYKAAKSSVSWNARDGTHTITLVTRISPTTGVESSVGGGTLSINVRDSLAAAIQNAQVHIVNSSLTPSIDLTTYTDSVGNATLIGAPAGSGYQAIATKAGYSTAQTYTASSTNTNPSPANLGVSLNQTTVATFGIDLFSSKTIQTFLPVTRATTTEPFTFDTGIASSTDITVAGGIARLTQSDSSYPASGMFISTVVSTSSIARWQQFSFVQTKPSGTNIIYRIYDANGVNLIPESQLPGNIAGFTTSPVNLLNISTSTYAALTVFAHLTTTNPANTPSIDSWSISDDSGPMPLPNIALTLRGEKTTGSGPGGTLYKYDNQSLSSGVSASVTVNNLEFDTYTIGVNSSTRVVSSACNPQPEALAANSTQTTLLFLSPYTTNSLLVDVKSASGATIQNASVRLYRAAPAYNTTILSDSCGQSFFSGLSSGTSGSQNAYSLQVTATGYQTYTSTTVNVSGTSRFSPVLNN